MTIYYELLFKIKKGEEELRNKLTDDFSMKVNQLICNWEVEIETADKQEESAKCTELIASLEEYDIQKDTFRQQVINYRRKLEKNQNFSNYVQKLITITSNIDNLKIFQEELISSVRSYLNKLDQAICDEILRNSKFECCICQDEISRDDIFVIGQCDHEMCRHCARETFKMSIRERKLPPPCPKCSMDPCEKCPVSNESKMSIDKFCTISDVDFQILLNDEEWMEYVI